MAFWNCSLFFCGSTHGRHADQTSHSMPRPSKKRRKKACRHALRNVGNFTFSDFDVDILSHPELGEGGDGPVHLLGPAEEVLVAVGKQELLLDLTGEWEVSRLEANLRAHGYLKVGRKHTACYRYHKYFSQYEHRGELINKALWTFRMQKNKKIKIKILQRVKTNPTHPPKKHKTKQAAVSEITRWKHSVCHLLEPGPAAFHLIEINIVHLFKHHTPSSPLHPFHLAASQRHIPRRQTQRGWDIFLGSLPLRFLPSC